MFVATVFCSCQWRMSMVPSMLLCLSKSRRTVSIATSTPINVSEKTTQPAAIPQKKRNPCWNMVHLSSTAAGRLPRLRGLSGINPEHEDGVLAIELAGDGYCRKGISDLCCICRIVSAEPHRRLRDKPLFAGSWVPRSMARSQFPNPSGEVEGSSFAKSPP